MIIARRITDEGTLANSSVKFEDLKEAQKAADENGKIYVTMTTWKRAEQQILIVYPFQKIVAISREGLRQFLAALKKGSV